MIKHILLFKFKEDTPENAINKIIEKFKECKNKIDGFLDIEYGVNVSDKKNLSEGFTFAVIMVFSDKKAIDAYNNLKEHQDAQELQKPYLDKVLVFDIKN